MPKRSPCQHSKHDHGVEGTAKYYESQGYQFQADVPGCDRPDTIDARSPDVIATGHGEMVIVDVETRETLDKDRAQKEIFEDFADEHRNVRFRRKTV